MIGAYRGQWVRPPLESSLPHEILDQYGQNVVGHGFQFGNKTAATRYLNSFLRSYNGSRHGPDDPHNWTVRPVKGGA
jgi:hypothetical protein